MPERKLLRDDLGRQTLHGGRTRTSCATGQTLTSKPTYIRSPDVLRCIATSTGRTGRRLQTVLLLGAPLSSNRYKFTVEAPFIADYVSVKFFYTLSLSLSASATKPAGSVLHNLLNFWNGKKLIISGKFANSLLKTRSAQRTEPVLEPPPRATPAQKGGVSRTDHDLHAIAAIAKIWNPWTEPPTWT